MASRLGRLYVRMTREDGLQDTLQSEKGLCPGLFLSPLRALQVSDHCQAQAWAGGVWGAGWDVVSGEDGVMGEGRG